MQAKPMARARVMCSCNTKMANSEVHNGKLPGINTDACAAGA
jgi:hypothetical protein